MLQHAPPDMTPLILNALKSLSIGTWQTALAIAVTGFIAWVRVQEQRWVFRSKRTKAFNDLLKDDRWRRVSPLELHNAMIDAYGKTVEQTELAFMMTRSRCAYLLRDRLAAISHVRFKGSCDGWDPVETGVSGPKLRRRGRNYAIVAIVSTGFALELAMGCLTKFDSLYLMPLAVFLVIAAAFFALAGQFESASRVVDVDAMFPALVPMPPHLEPVRLPTQPSAAPKEPAAGTKRTRTTRPSTKAAAPRKPTGRSDRAAAGDPR